MATPTPPAEQPPIKVPCGCRGCTQPAAFLRRREGVMGLEIMSRHHGHYHTTRLTVDQVVAMLTATDTPGHHPMKP